MKISISRLLLIVLCAIAIVPFMGCDRSLFHVPAETEFLYMNFPGPIGKTPYDYFSIVVEGDTVEWYEGDPLMDYSIGRFLISKRYDDQYELVELRHPGEVTDSVVVEYVPHDQRRETISIKIMFNPELEWCFDKFTIISEKEDLSCKASEGHNYIFDLDVSALQDSVTLRADRSHPSPADVYITELRPTSFNLGTFALRPGHDMIISFPNFNRKRSWYAPLDGELLLYDKGDIYWRGKRFRNLGRITKQRRRYRREHGPYCILEDPI